MIPFAGRQGVTESKWLITSGAFVSMSFIGMSRTFLGTALPAILTLFHEATYILSSYSLLFVSLFFAIYVPGKWAIPFFGVSGLVLSGVFPSLLGMTGKIYTKIPGASMGILATGAGIGSVIIPWLMSLISQLIGLKAGFFSFEVFVALCIGLMGIQLRHLRVLIPIRVPAR